MTRRTANDTVQNLLSGAKLFGWRPSAVSFVVTLEQLLVLCALIWGLSALDDFIDTEFRGALSLWGLTTDATQNYCWLLAIALVAVLSRKPSLFLALAVGTAAVSTVLWIGWIICTHSWNYVDPDSYDQHVANVWWSIFGLEVVAFFRLLGLFSGFPFHRTAALGVVYAAVVLAATWYLPTRPLFNVPWPADGSAAIDVEATYYAQQNLMRHALHDIAPGREGVVDVYAIGFAGYGHQDVFKREAEQAIALIEDRYDATRRTVTLINNPATTESTPLANRPNLKRTISEMAARMNRHEDVLFVFLTSHGDDNAEISVDLADLGMHDLTASDLKSALDEAAIQWRVIIVSACYSGSFIETLAGPTSLVITAAAADKTSFGCSHERDWTYFGEAFFKHALPKSETLIDAFHTARARLEQREREENKEPSQPQISIGSEIERYLSEQKL